jgi:hypothetical protein
MQCILYKIYFWKVFHMNYNLICIFICSPICTNFFYSCKKWVLHIPSIYSLLSNASSLVTYQAFKSLFTDSSHVKFGHPLPLFSLSVCLITSLRIGASAGLRWICQTISSDVARASPQLVPPLVSCISSFRT